MTNDVLEYAFLCKKLFAASQSKIEFAPSWRHEITKCKKMWTTWFYYFMLEILKITPLFNLCYKTMIY